LKQTLQLKTIVIAILLGLGFVANGQDIHFTQFNYSPLNLNPALTGVFKGNMRFLGTYRSQWQSVPVPYMTFSGAFDMNYYNRRKWKNSIFGGGIGFYYDQAGDGDMTLSQFALSGSYTRRMSQKDFLSAGLLVNLSQRAFDINKLSFDMQFNGELFDPSMGSGEDFINTSTFFADFTVGANWHHQEPEKRMRVDAGVALFHINQPNTSFEDNRDVFLAVADKVDALFRAMGQFQGTYREIVLSIGGRYHISQKKTKELAVALNLGLRLQDAFVPSIEIDYQSWRIGLAYDVNTSGFMEATDFRGGPEITLIYFFRKVAPLAAYRACPIF